jgi:hypothetical protein
MRAGKPDVVFAPVVLDMQMLRAIVWGVDPHPRLGGNLPGGSLADRLRKVSAAALGLAA